MRLTTQEIHQVCTECLLWVNISADDIVKYFSYYSQKSGFDSSCKLSQSSYFSQKTGFDISCNFIPMEMIRIIASIHHLHSAYMYSKMD